MHIACRSLLVALVAQLTLAWVPSPALTFDLTSETVVMMDHHNDHKAGMVHCATGVGASCQVPAILDIAAALLFHPKATCAARPVSEYGIALMPIGPPTPIPIG